MKKFTVKCLKCLRALIAVKLIIIAVLLTTARFVFTEVNDYKDQLIEWVATEHNISVSVENISAGIDFSGLILTLKEVKFTETEVLPFELALDHLFVHLDFMDSISKQKLVFNDVSLKGVELVLKPHFYVETPKEAQSKATQSQVTLDSLKSIFLSRLSSFSIKESTFQFTDHLDNEKIIFIQDLSWLNNGNRHQGVGKASLQSSLGKNTLEFVIDINGDSEGGNDQLTGQLYANADNLNVLEYLTPQINALAELKTAAISFELWSEFDFNGPKGTQLKLKDAQIAWSMLAQSHDWKINDGLVQFIYQDESWLFDTYHLDVLHNYIPWMGLTLSGQGVANKFGEFDLNAVNVNAILPFALLFSSLPETEIKKISSLEMGGELTKLGLTRDSANEYMVNATIDGFNNQALNAIPGINNANIEIQVGAHAGNAKVTLPPQNIDFNSQFNRPIPVKKGEFELNWINNDQGFELKSNKTLLVTDELDSITQFSLFFPNEGAVDRSPFLSLYVYASLNDAEKTQYYLPMAVLGDDVFDYLAPTLKKGTVKGAKIVWYGALSDYPYEKNNGIFQAWVPVKNADYDFYDQWEGLTALDVDLFFENDYLLMESHKATLGDINIGQLSGKVDHLGPNGVLTIKAAVEDSAESISKYLATCPFEDNVGSALDIIHVDKKLKGDLVLSIPFNQKIKKTNITGTIQFLDNNIDIELADGNFIPFKGVEGQFSFSNGDLMTNGLSATLFEQAIDFSISTKALETRYHIQAELSGVLKTDRLSHYYSDLSPLQLSGNVDWKGNIDFSQIFAGGYEFDVNVSSPLQGITTTLPSPYNKNSLESWPLKVSIKGDQVSTKWHTQIHNKVKLVGELNYQAEQSRVPYFYMELGKTTNLPINYTKQVIRINEEEVNLTRWAEVIKGLVDKRKLTIKNNHDSEKVSLINIDNIYVDIKEAQLFEQPLINLSTQLNHSENHWNVNIKADNLLANIDYRQGIPDRYDINIDKMDFQLLDVQSAQDLLAVKEGPLTKEQSVKDSQNLRESYPEIFLACKQCIYKEMDFSSLQAHVFPSQSRYNIDYVRLGKKEESTSISGVWNQRHTNIIVDSKASSKASIIHRLGYDSPLIYEEATLSGAFNWVGAPWQFNLLSLNGVFSTEVKNGLITEVNDKGARLLSFLSLDGIRRSLNLEFGNVFSKGLGFDRMSLSANITNGILQSDDYYLNGSAGKISGEGLIDLPNFNVNYQFSYSPAVTSSLPVLAAFAINPLTGAAVLMLTKILEPVIDTIIRVDFSVKGSLDDPKIKIEKSQQGKIKLQDSEVLEAMEGHHDIDASEMNGEY